MSEEVVNEAVERIVGKSLAAALLADGTGQLAKTTWVADPMAEVVRLVKAAYAEVRSAQDTLLTAEVALEKALVSLGVRLD